MPYKNLKIIKFKTYFYSNALFLEKKLIFALVKLKLCIMFRSFIFLLVSLLLVSCKTSSHREKDWKDQNLHGKVKKLIVTLYRISNSDFIKREDGTPFISQERLTVRIFNNKGFLMEETDSIYNKPESRTIYNYLKDNVVEIDMYGEGRKVNKTTLKYNNKGKIIDEELLEYILVNGQDSTYIREETYKLVNKYDEKGNIIRKEQLSPYIKNFVRGFTEFKYDEKGDIIEIVSDYEEYEMRRKFKSNNKRDVLSLKLYDLEDNLMSEYLITNYVYDKNHNWISRKIEGRDKNNEYIGTKIEKRIISYYE